MTKNAVVAGGGIAGTVAAIALHDAGFAPVIHEAHDRGADERGSFLTVAVNGLAALRTLGLDPDRLFAAGFATPAMVLRNAAGRQLARLPLGGPDPDGTTTTTIRRADLYLALRGEAERRDIPVRYGRRLTGRTCSPAGVTAHFADGTTAGGDLLIGADGLHSRTRSALDPAAPAPHYLGLLNAGGHTAGPVPPALRAEPGVMQMAFGRRAFFGWVTAPDDSVWWFANPPRRRPAGPLEFGPAAWRAELLELFAADAVPAAAIIRAADEIVGPWNTWDLPRVPVWRDDRTILIGDAAHAVSPSSGQGASMAIEDAVTLGRCLRARSDIAAALADYEHLRRGRVEKVVAYGRRSGSTKTAGPVGAAVRDALTPLVMRLLYRKSNPQAWILEHRIG
ncbi:FAD-dependent oxidoreductase [Actinoplanes auranticolor]|uniref:FAD-dependent oxidoreductase n=1 Tax=Actinoplanes auranticolor TaxID=47988 RepID=A0A919VVW8_9ACTN|nr:NAD(P)/FAD-dependent oxidoreductase [Actinoplanes auranticolor]GIM78791.1 FAD-dependent oxidoreductase [Actinoplanes auranticolor]